MIKYPNNDKEITRKDNPLKDAVDAGIVKVGQRFFVGSNPVTCVHIDGDKYIFSMDDIFKTASHDKITEVFETIWTTGMIDGIDIIPTGIIQDIDFLFVPSERQVFGENMYGIEEDDKQFEWFKRGDIARVKGYKGIESSEWLNGETCDWWLSTGSSQEPSYCCCVSHSGLANDYFSCYSFTGVPIFFQMTKEDDM